MLQATASAEAKAQGVKGNGSTGCEQGLQLRGQWDQKPLSLSLMGEAVTRALPPLKTRRLHVLKIQQAMHTDGWRTATDTAFFELYSLLLIPKPEKLPADSHICFSHLMFKLPSLGPSALDHTFR